MDKDVHYFTGSHSIRSLTLHIEHVEWIRLSTILRLMPTLQILELNGTIDFDIGHLLSLERNYTSFRCNLSHALTF